MTPNKEEDRLIASVDLECLKCSTQRHKDFEPKVTYYEFVSLKSSLVCPICNHVFASIPVFENGNGNGDADASKTTLLLKVTEEDIDFVINTIAKEAKYDVPAIKQIVYCLLSGMTNLAIHHKVNSKNAGAGKSYLTKKVASYFPEEHLMTLAGVTDKAFFYMKGKMVIKGEKPGEFIDVKQLIAELKMQRAAKRDKVELTNEEEQRIETEIERLKDESFRLIDLRFLAVILADTPQEGLLNAIMSILSQDNENAEYLYTDKNKMESTKKCNPWNASFYLH